MGPEHEECAPVLFFGIDESLDKLFELFRRQNVRQTGPKVLEPGAGGLGTRQNLFMDLTGAEIQGIRSYSLEIEKLFHSLFLLGVPERPILGGLNRNIKKNRRSQFAFSLSGVGSFAWRCLRMERAAEKREASSIVLK